VIRDDRQGGWGEWLTDKILAPDGLRPEQVDDDFPASS
jgi:hypothetical protein